MFMTFFVVLLFCHVKYSVIGMTPLQAIVLTISHLSVLFIFPADVVKYLKKNENSVSVLRCIYLKCEGFITTE